MRRQSSAFEFSRPESGIAKCMTLGRPGVGPSHGIRRQSSAFEISASARYWESTSYCFTAKSAKNKLYGAWFSTFLTVLDKGLFTVSFEMLKEPKAFNRKKVLLFWVQFQQL